MYAFFFLLLLSGCNQNPPPKETRREIYSGRTMTPIYQAEVPLHWKRKDPTDNRYISDTMLPFCSYEIEGALLTLHNFPCIDIEKRIAPEAQITRWKLQVTNGRYEVSPFSHGGFGGYRLEAENEKDGMIAYAMQLTPALFQAIPKSSPDLLADYTLKFTGTKDDIEKHRNELDDFALSFEWIEPFPCDLL